MKLNPASAPLEQRIRETWRELERLIDEEAKLQSKGGVPAVNIKQQLLIRGGCLCSTAMQIIKDRKTAADLVERQTNESKQPKSAARTA
jgi:hypothetical protein